MLRRVQCVYSDFFNNSIDIFSEVGIQSFLDDWSKKSLQLIFTISLVLWRNIALRCENNKSLPLKIFLNNLTAFTSSSIYIRRVYTVFIRFDIFIFFLFFLFLYFLQFNDLLLNSLSPRFQGYGILCL